MKLKRLQIHGIRHKRVTSLMLIILFVCVSPTLIFAQFQEKPHTTLSGWETHTGQFIKDRSNSFGGFYYDRGLFRMHTHEMTPEYRIDLFTYRFSYFDDYDWHQAENGFRTMVGSLNTPEFAVHSQLKTTQQVSENGTLMINGYQQEDRRARRSLFTFGYEYQAGDRHRVGASHTLGQKKTDLDATLYYQFGDRERGFITAEITLLDWMNNFVTGLSEDRQSEFEIHHTYSEKPYLYVLRAESPRMGPFRGEAVAGIQPMSQAQVTRRDQLNEDFILRDWVNYQGALFEGNYRGLTAGIIYQRTFAKMERFAAEGSDYPLDYGNHQQMERGGVYFTYRWNRFGIEQWFWIERNSDTQFDDAISEYRAQDPNASGRYPFDFNELRRWNKTKLFYKSPGNGLSVYLEHNGDWRDLAMDGETGDGRVFEALNYRSYYNNQIVSRNERLTLSFGYRFNQNLWLTLGASYDIDGDLKDGFDRDRVGANPARFDGGFGRMQFTW